MSTYHVVSERNVRARLDEGGKVQVLQALGSLPGFAVLEFSSYAELDTFVGELIAFSVLAWPADRISYRCRRCGRVSFNPNDALHSYCGACHAYEDNG
jgi:hypothetical protein